MTAALRKSSEGPIPWALRHQSANTQMAQHQQPLSAHNFFLGPHLQPPVRRASLQHQKPEEGGTLLDAQWPVPLAATSSAHFWIGQQQGARGRCDSLASTGQLQQRPAGAHFEQRPLAAFHRRSQPQLCHADSQELVSAGALFRYSGIGSHQQMANEQFYPAGQQQQQRFGGRFGIGAQKMPSQPVLAPQNGTTAANTPPRPRRQFPPLICQNSLGGSCSPLGSPRVQRKFGTFGIGTPPQQQQQGGINSPMRKASVGPIYGMPLVEEDFRLIGHQQRPQKSGPRLDEV